MKKLFLSTLACMLLSLFSCNQEEALPSEYNLTFIETYPKDEVTDPVLLLKIETEKIYPCMNYSLNTRIINVADQLNIKISGADIGEVCLTALGPATAQLPLPKNIKQLSITSNGHADVYLLSIAEGKLNIVPIIDRISQFDYDKYYLIPENSLAYTCGTLLENTEVCSEFDKILQNNLNLTEIKFPENAKISYPRSSSGHWNNAPAKYYRYENENDLEKAGVLLKNYYETNLSGTQGTSLSIIGWNNTRFRNNKRIN